MSDRLEIRPVPLPLRAGGADGGVFRTLAATADAVARHDSGTTLFDQDAGVRLARLHDTAHAEKLALAAWRGDEAAGFGVLSAPRATRRVAVDVLAAPGARDEEAADLLHAELERRARALDGEVLHGYAFASPAPATALLTAATGWGAVPADAAATRFFLRHGYVLAQVERASAYDLTRPADDLAARLAEARRVAGPDYAVAWWAGATPEEHVAGFAAALSRMATDIPSGGFAAEADPWDADRVRHRDAVFAAAGELLGVAAAIHAPTGRLVAFNELVAPPDRRRPTENHATLVLPEHRGRRLGTVVKCLNLLRWRESVPEAPAVTTFNAEENRPMLAVNEAVGFETVAVTGEWKKEIR